MLDDEARRRPRPKRKIRAILALVVAAGAVACAVLAIVSWSVYDETENRLLQQRTEEAAAVLEVAVGQVRAPLDAAAQVATITDGDPAAFAATVANSVGEGRLYTSAVMFRVGQAEPVTTAGARAALLDAPADVRQRVASGTAAFRVVDLLTTDRRLGYAVTDQGASPAFVVYAERILNADPTVRLRTDEPFAQLDYAIYLGENEDRAALLGASVADLPMSGRVARTTFPFGDTSLTLVMRPIGHLSSDVFANLWRTIIGAGALATAGAAFLTRRLLLGRETALALSDENQRLYEEQRQIAETLQLSLMPQRLAVPPKMDVAARYWPAGEAALIGGDFYDAFDVGDGRWAITIGDVCGKGIESATFTGLARHTLRTAARHGSSPSEVLRSVHQAMSEHEPSTFCTVFFAYLSPRTDGGVEVTMSLGGHPQPLLRRANGSVEAVGAVGSLLGIFEPDLTDTVIVLEPGDLLMMYTDGLTDAPGQEAVPLEELTDKLAHDGAMPLEPLADGIRVLKRRRRPHGSGDDTAIMLVRHRPAESADDASLRLSASGVRPPS